MIVLSHEYEAVISGIKPYLLRLLTQMIDFGLSRVVHEEDEGGKTNSHTGPLKVQ